MTTAVATKKALLDNAGYVYDFIHMLYFNRDTKKAFSVQFVEDNPPEVLEKSIQEPSNTQRWEFYVRNALSESVRHQVEAALD